MCIYYAQKNTHFKETNTMQYQSMTPAQLQAEREVVAKKFEELKAKGLKLDMSRGKPGKA